MTKSQRREFKNDAAEHREKDRTKEKKIQQNLLLRVNQLHPAIKGETCKIIQFPGLMIVHSAENILVSK